MKYVVIEFHNVVANSLEIMQKKIAILSYYVSLVTGFSLYSLKIWSKENMLLQNSCKFGQALQIVFAIDFLTIFSLIMAF